MTRQPATDTAPQKLSPPPLPQAGERWALFLDLDGTLLPLAERPEDVAPSADLAKLLHGLSRQLDGALAILSGRRVADLRHLLPGLPEQHLVGCHGLEHASGVRVARPELDKARQAIAPAIAKFDGVWIEEKPHAFAVHYRANPAAGYSVERLASEQLARFDGLRALSGNHVVEVLPVEGSKGAAVARIWAMLDDRKPVALGDDVTDEEAFAAAERRHGFGVCVGSRRPTRARYGLPCVVATRLWLEQLSRSLAAARHDSPTPTAEDQS